MRGLPRGLAARITLLNVLVFSISTLGVIALTVTLAERSLRSNLEEALMAEVDIMRKDYAIDGIHGVRGLIDLREHFDSGRQARTYRLEAADGTLMAGHWPHWLEGLEPDGDPLRLANSGRGEGVEWLFRATALPDGSRLLVGFDNYELLQVRAGLRDAALWTFALALLLAIGGGVLVSRTALTQVDTIRRSADRIMQGDLQHRIPVRAGGDEFDELSRTLNRMLDRINELIGAIRNATDAIAHDLRTPLTRLRAELEHAQLRPPAPEQLPDWLQDQLQRLDQVLHTFSALLQLATVESGVLRAQFGAVDLRAVLADTMSLYDAAAAERGVRVAVEAPEAPLPVPGDRNLLAQTVANLLDNALKFSPDSGEIRVALRADGGMAVIEIRDEGAGIAAADAERVFERFYRGDSARATPGFGLGLSLVRAVARLHGGDCRLLPVERGTCVRMTLAR
jgi:signal transduction histidine kinase